jgi:hypothetical protein
MVRGDVQGLSGYEGEGMTWQEEYCKEYTRTTGRACTIEASGGSRGFISHSWHYLMDREGKVVICRRQEDFFDLQAKTL